MPVTPEAASGFSTMSSAIEFADNYNTWIVQTFLPHIRSRILEVGTGQGNFRRYLPTIHKYVSIDINPDVVQRAAQRDPDNQYVCADISDLQSLTCLHGFDFDTVLCTNVLEHIERDRQAVENMLTVLCPGGKLLLFVPAFPALYSSMDKLAGHYRRYTKRSLRRLLAGTDGKIEVLEYFNPIGGFGWWVNKLMNHQNLDSKEVNKQIEIFDKYVVPFSRMLNYFTKSFFGQSVVCAISKV